MSTLITTCDDCGRKMEVDADVHNDHFCVLALCTECSSLPVSTNVLERDYDDAETSFAVIGRIL